MNQLIEFAGNHPYLVSAAVLMIVVVIVSEMRQQAQAFAAVNTNDAIRMMNQGGVMIDVRPAEDFRKAHINNARNVELSSLESEAESLKKYREKPVITCCDTGANGATAARQLSKLGFTKVVNLRGGLSAWRQENLPLVLDKASA